MSPAADNGPAFEAMQLERLIREISPRRVLLMGPAGEALLADYVQRHPDCQVETMAPEELPEDFGDERFDLAFVSHTLERLDKRQGEELVARLRDLLCRRLLLLVPIGPGWPGHRSVWEETDLLGLGLMHLGGYRYKGRPVHLYGYDIATYKTTPDWLNNRFWANPELFDKHWW